MATIYLHIPFCRKACFYCDFHFTTSLRYKGEMLSAMLKEIELRSALSGKEKIDSIYFGGGTPSILSAEEITAFLDKIYLKFEIAADAEITMEANPDDLNPEYLKRLKTTTVNRLSIGIQSFFQEDLHWMNRSHNAKQAKECLELAAAYGYNNLNLDLIYGYPLLDDDKWKENLDRVLSSGARHLSAYAMTVEPKTMLHKQILSHKTPAMNEEQAARQFELLMEEAEKAGWEQYEISNFCRDGAYSKHNSAYWKGVPYLGIGPSAHSYDGSQRCWNIRNNRQYIDQISKGSLALECEILNDNEAYNETIMTGLRTKWGVHPLELESRFGSNFRIHFENSLKSYADYYEYTSEGAVVLNRRGKLLADRIAAHLFIV